MEKKSEYTNEYLLSEGFTYPTQLEAESELIKNYGFQKAIESNRPFPNGKHAHWALYEMSNVLALVEAAMGTADIEPLRPDCYLMRGAATVIRMCRVLAKRGEEFANSVSEQEKQREMTKTEHSGDDNILPFHPQKNNTR